MLNIKSLRSSKSFSPRKNVRPGFQEKSGRHIGLKRPYVLGHFEVKQEIWGCLATFLGTVKRRFFLFRYAQRSSFDFKCPQSTFGIICSQESFSNSFSQKTHFVFLNLRNRFLVKVSGQQERSFSFAIRLSESGSWYGFRP